MKIISSNFKTISFSQLRSYVTIRTLYM